MKQNVSYVLLLVIMVLACKNPAKESITKDQTATGIGQLRFSYTDGRALMPELLRGKMVFVNFWATWCKPCVAEMPSLQRMVDKLSSDSLVFLFASDENAEDIERFRQTKGYRMTFVRVLEDAGLSSQGLPFTALFDREGKLVFSELGARTWDSEANLQLLKKLIQNP